MKKYFLVHLALIAILSGCSSKYLTNQPAIFPACGQNAEDAQIRSLGAIIEAIETRRGWNIEEFDKDEAKILASACRGTICIYLDILVKENGQVEILRSPEQYLSSDWGNVLKGWVIGLKRQYGKFRWTDTDELRAVVNRYSN